VRILFDQGTPVPLRKHLSAHQVVTIFELGWNHLKNGELLQKAEENGFSVLVTTDQNLRYQQNLAGRKIAIVVLTTTSWPRIERAVASVAKAVVLPRRAHMLKFLSRDKLQGHDPADFPQTGSVVYR
jgi:predicted nuclease of predicted toxin-antitoxin system